MVFCPFTGEKKEAPEDVLSLDLAVDEACLPGLQSQWKV